MRFPGFATRNLRLKGIAAGLAAVLWAGVAYASNPPDTRSVSVPVPQDLASVAPFVLVHGIPDVVIRVSGTRDHLTAFSPADLVVSVNYRAIKNVGLQSLPLTVVNNDRDVLLDNPPATVIADVDRLDSRTVTVNVVTNPLPPQGYVVVSKQASPSSVTVIGPQHQLAGVEAKVTVNLANQKTNFQADEQVGLYNSATGQQVGTFGVTVAGQRQATVLVTVAGGGQPHLARQRGAAQGVGDCRVRPLPRGRERQPGDSGSQRAAGPPQHARLDIDRDDLAERDHRHPQLHRQPVAAGGRDRQSRQGHRDDHGGVHRPAAAVVARDTRAHPDVLSVTIAYHVAASRDGGSLAVAGPDRQ